MRHIICILFLAPLFISACASSQKLIKHDPAALNTSLGLKSKTSVIALEKQEFHISKTPDLELQSQFQKLLDDAYAKAIEELPYNSAELGFTYSFRPTGAIYPFSEVEVSCLIKQHSEEKGKLFCKAFFTSLQAGYRAMLSARAQKTIDEALTQEKAPAADLP